MHADHDPYDSRLLPRDFLSSRPASPPAPASTRPPAAPVRAAEATRPSPSPPASSKAPPSSLKAQVLADELCKRVDLSDEATALPRDGITAWAFIERLIEKRLHTDALRLTAHVLGKREAVWWGCQCARCVLEANPAPPILAGLKAAETWAGDPSEANRRAAHSAAEAARLTHPAGALAMAAFFSGGSLAPPDLPAVPPRESLTAEVVAGAVLLAAVLAEPHKAAEKHRRFLALGVEVAKGINKWRS